MCTKLWSKSLKGREQLRDQSIDVRILDCILKELGCKGVGLIHLSQYRDQWQALNDCRNEPLGSIKSRNFLTN
jgi:hypothetical protein